MQQSGPCTCVEATPPDRSLATPRRGPSATSVEVLGNIIYEEGEGLPPPCGICTESQSAHTNSSPPPASPRCHVASSSAVPPRSSAPAHPSSSPAPQKLWSAHVNGQHFADTGRPFILEVFCGCAALTSSFRALGMDAWGVDYTQGKVASLTSAVVYMDLTMPKHQAGLYQLLSHPRLAFVHWAPPGDTANRAREIHIPGGPQPLRSEDYPLGLPDLHIAQPRQVRRVHQANELYRFTAEAIGHLSSRGIPWTLGGRSNSLLWHVPAFRALLSADTDDVMFDDCMWGGSRPIRTRMRSSPGVAFAALWRLCDRSHSHSTWADNAQVDASLTSAYTDTLCRVLVNFGAELFGHTARISTASSSQSQQHHQHHSQSST